ncbi:aminoglycoside phosphotransferase family protein [Longispora sp. K20-0274]|uniref:phosphotransferase n=1 Tax=Longispora sp. K20-0274 TaxID=3088255 RepID=UPI00399A4BDA
MTEAAAILSDACAQAGLDPTGATLIRAGENTLYRLTGGVVARITRPGQFATAAKEIAVAAWLRSADIPVVEPVPHLHQPYAVSERGATFWVDLGHHQRASTSDLAGLLRRVHSLPVPNELALPSLAPFIRIADRINGAPLPAADRNWLLSHLAQLQDRYDALTTDLSTAVHGDAWSGNVALTKSGPVLLDLERFAVGRPEWDLTSTAVDHETFGTVTAPDWNTYCRTYGQDVTSWEHYPTYRDVRELRKVSFALQIATERPEHTGQAIYRIRCIQGYHGPRPWAWRGVA